jgi:hypothetical protein
MLEQHNEKSRASRQIEGLQALSPMIGVGGRHETRGATPAWKGRRVHYHPISFIGSLQGKVNATPAVW